ncbi:MAG: GNAT family N-acetyltransferase [Desulfobacteraceae bacterium]|nr:GNAT family N-acetyltransferase [Desulfobacteraceae bacterium]
MMIQEMGKYDFQNLTALAIQVWLHTYATEGIRDKISKFVFNKFTPEYFECIYKAKNQDLLIAVENRHLVGFITIDLGSRCGIDDFQGYEVVTLYVQEHFQEKGIGTKLLNAMMDKHGSKQWLSTWVHNYKAILFYENFGFKNIGTILFNLEGEKHENLVLAMPY